MSKFFFVVVEVEEDPALLNLMESPPRVADTLQLPDGCSLKTCFEMNPDYARVIINM
jgi:hypothetical protein